MGRVGERALSGFRLDSVMRSARPLRKPVLLEGTNGGYETHANYR